MSDDPFNPAMRRIAPSDLLAPRPVAAPRPGRWPDPTFPPDSSACPPGSTSLPTTAPPPSSAQPSAASGTCPHCNGAGWYKEAVPFGHPRFGKPLPCACKLAEREVLAQRRQQERLQQLIGVAGRFATATFDTFAADRAYPGPVEWIDPRYGDSRRRWYSPEFQARSIAGALATAKAFVAAKDGAADPRGGLLLQGPYGSGKTHLAFAVAGHLVRQGATIAADSLPALLQFIRDGFADNSAGQRLQDLKTVDVLVLDDVGAERETDWTEEQVYQVVNHRYVFGMTTLFTSNEPVTRLPGRIGSRIAEFADVVSVIAYDYRLIKHAARRAG